jgi:response regulator of citrate/malate metabolism
VTDTGIGIRAGMNDYLSKPIDIEALRSVIDRWTTEPVSVAWNPALCEQAAIEVIGRAQFLHS